MEHNLVTFCNYQEALETFEKLVAASFGPCGSQVLITTNSGQCLVSKDGKHIMKACVTAKPLDRWIKDRIKGYFKSSGDGSKSFVLLLAELIRRVKAHHGHFGTVDSNRIGSILLKTFCQALLEHFAILAREMIPTIVATTIISSSACGKTAFCDTDEFWEFLKQCTFTVLQGNLGNQNARLLSNLTIQFVKLPNPELHLEEHISYVVNNFAQFCQEVSGYSVTDSYIMEGVLIQRDFAYQDLSLNGCDEDLNILLTAYDFHVEQQNAYLTVSSMKGINLVASWNEAKWKKVVDNLKRLNVTALISVNIVPEPLIALCRVAGISVIHSVYIEDLCHISDQTGIPLNYELPNNLTWFTHTVSFLKRVILGKSAYCCAGFRSNTGQMLKHLIVCAPTSAMCRSYSSAIQDSLKNVTITLGSRFECDGSTHEQEYSVHEGGGCSTSHRQLYSIYGGGVAEVIASNKFRDLSKNYSNTNKMTQLALICFAECLEIIPKTLHNNSYQIKPNKYLEGKLGSVQESPYGINASTGHWVPAKEVGIVEPLTHKLTLWQQVLESFCDLFRIDSIIGVCKATSNHQRENDH